LTLDPNEDIELEAESCKELEASGCPPCYPPDIGYPSQEPPEEYRGVLTYWENPGRGLVLAYQLRDWRTFLSQIPPSEDSVQRSRSEIWAMFEKYHHRKRKHVDQKIANLRRRMEKAPKWDVGYQMQIEAHQRWCKRHDGLMLWIEQHRPTTAAQDGA